jgi:hypothetical protein
MVRAILAGQKSQTRRIVKGIPLQPAPRCHPDHKASPDAWDDVRCFGDEWSFRGETALTEHLIRCPYGKPGDRLWVKETVSESEPCYLGGRPQPTVWYRADNNRPTWAERKWTPSIHCARRLSRITLEITDVRVERLNDISEEDARAEGITSRQIPKPWGNEPGWSADWSRVGTPSKYARDGKTVADEDICLASARLAYWNLWQSINGPGSWDANPFVWVVSFKRVEQ